MNKPLRVLIVEDSEDDARLLLHELRRGGYDPAFERVETADAMRAALDPSTGPGHRWDVILSDYRLPQFSAPAALALLQVSGLDLPFIIISGTIGEDTAVAALKAGAHDFIVKGNWARLIPAVEREMRDAEARRARKQAEDELRAAEAKYRALVEQLPAIVYGLSFGETVWTSYISPQVETLLGFTPAEWLADPELWIKQLHPDDRERVLAEVGKTGAEGRPLNVEYRTLARDGRALWFHNQATLVLDAAGRPFYSYGIMFDITGRKRAEEQMRQNAARAEALARVASRLNAQLDLDTVLKAICEETARALNVPASSVALYEPAQAALLLASAFGLPSNYRQDHKPVPRAVYDEYARQAGPLVLPDVQHTPGLPNAELYVRHNIRTIATAAMSRGGEMMGTLDVYTFNERRDFDPDELALLNALADQAAQAIANARLFEEAERRLRHVEALRAIDVSITGSMDVRLSLNVVLGQAMDQLRVDAADVLLLDRHTQALEYAAGRGFRTDAIIRAHVRLGEGYAGLAALERRLIRIPDWNDEEPDLRRAAEFAGENFRACFVVPLIAKGNARGVLEVFHRQPLHPDEEWLDFLEALAGQAALAIDNASLFNDLQRSNVELTLAYDTTLEGWSRALDLRDKETEGHTQRVTEMTLRLARAAGTFGEDELVNARRGALLHDIGKMGIPDSILLKPGPLTDDEWIVMRKHPVYAYELLMPIPFLRSALDIPYCHHEKWDGTGYPRGLRGELIPLAARLFAVVDVWDALRSDRPYRPGWPEDKVREHIRAGAGAHFEPRAVEIFLDVNR